MRSFLSEERKERIASYLAHQRTGVICTIAAQGMWAMPIWYRPNCGPSGSRNLEVDCLLPRWVSTLQPDALYLVVRVTPGRIDLVDEDLGWGEPAIQALSRPWQIEADAKRLPLCGKPSPTA